MKYIFLLFSLFHSFAFAEPVYPMNLGGKYDIHLYFDSKPFLDELTLVVSGFQTVVKGVMHVPDDFDASVDDFIFNPDNTFSFNILIPKNASRPKDVHAKYFGTFYDNERKVFVGFAKIIEDDSFMASFIGQKK